MAIIFWLFIVVVVVPVVVWKARQSARARRDGSKSASADPSWAAAITSDSVLGAGHVAHPTHHHHPSDHSSGGVTHSDHDGGAHGGGFHGGAGHH